MRVEQRRPARPAEVESADCRARGAGVRALSVAGPMLLMPTPPIDEGLHVPSRGRLSDRGHEPG